MEDEVLSFRKFLSEDIDTYVSVRTANGGSPEVRDDRYQNLILTLGDGTDSVSIYSYICNNTDTLDKDYEEAMGKLEVLRVAIETAMHELSDGYARLSLDEDEVFIEFDFS